MGGEARTAPEDGRDVELRGLESWGRGPHGPALTPPVAMLLIVIPPPSAAPSPPMFGVRTRGVSNARRRSRKTVGFGGCRRLGERANDMHAGVGRAVPTSEPASNPPVRCELLGDEARSSVSGTCDRSAPSVCMAAAKGSQRGGGVAWRRSPALSGHPRAVVKDPVHCNWLFHCFTTIVMHCGSLTSWACFTCTASRQRNTRGAGQLVVV
jgi:hypothetical protein